MPWTGEPHLGFTLPDVEPWLPAGDPSRNVAEQRDDPGSVLHLTRELIAIKRARPDLREGRYVTMEASEDVWVWRRGDHTVVALTHSDGPLDVVVGEGAVLLSTRPGRGGERIDGRVHLEPWEALVIAQQTGA
jgi:alpha-glucosidase